MGTDFKHHCAFLEEELQVLWKLGVITIKGGVCVVVGQSLGCNTFTAEGRSIPGRSYREAEALMETIPM